MTDQTHSHADGAWTAIERDKKADRFNRRICVGAWVATFASVFAYGVIAAVQVTRILSGNGEAFFRGAMTFGMATQFILMFGIVSALVATLATIGVFMRMRTTTMAEIQLRLAALEDILTAKDEGR